MTLFQSRRPCRRVPSVPESKDGCPIRGDTCPDSARSRSNWLLCPRQPPWRRTEREPPEAEEYSLRRRDCCSMPAKSGSALGVGTRRGRRALAKTAAQLTDDRQRRRDAGAAESQIVGQVDYQILTSRNRDHDRRPTGSRGIQLRAACPACCGGARVAPHWYGRAVRQATELGAAVKFTVCCATAQLAPRRRIQMASNTVLTVLLEWVNRMSISSDPQ